MFFQIAKTPQEKKQAAIYWENIRIQTQKIRDEHDKVQEDKYHRMFYEKVIRNCCANIRSGYRPEFLEPINVRNN